ncbi:MAG: hypothetical protein WDN00_12115 [Limisphaerales bacterium]
MSTASELDLNLENLFQPSWAQGKTEPNRFEKFTGNEGVKPERSFNSKPGERRAPRRDGPALPVAVANVVAARRHAVVPSLVVVIAEVAFAAMTAVMNRANVPRRPLRCRI